MSQDAYVTMLFSDGYLQGAQVLAASLRDGGTTKKLAVIVPADEAHRLLPQTISQLEELFDFVLPMPTLASSNTSNLRLLNRPDLVLTLTKINVWQLVQFRKCVYVDADVLALRAPDELFSLDVDFAAAPDVGWPDIFNSGVFLFKPSMATYYALKALAESGITFDGGDQGLLNTFFPTYHRLSFTYNVTPSTNYQYTPAYRYFSSNISLFHFIGRSKPWSERSVTGGGSFNEATGRWWSVYEKHFGWKIREEELKRSQEMALSRGRDGPPRSRFSEQYLYSSPVQYERRPSSADMGEKQVSFGSTDTTFFHTSAPASELPNPSYHVSIPHRDRSPPRKPFGSSELPSVSYDVSISHRERSPPRKPFESSELPGSSYHDFIPHRETSPPSKPFESSELPPSSYHVFIPHREPSPPGKPFESSELWSPSHHTFIPHREPSPPQKPFEPTMVTWDPARSAPPSDSGPEAQGLSISTYESAWDKPFNPDEPKWVPPPRSALPKGYEYTPPPPPESHDISSESEEEIVETSGYDTSDSEGPEEHRTKRYTPVFPWEMGGQRQTATRVFPGDEPAKDKGKAVEARSYDRRASFDKYEFTNAWDSLPIIQSYVKQKLGETPSPGSAEPKPKVESSSTPSSSKGVLATNSVVSTTEAEQWDPNKQLDKLKSGVIRKLREQQKRFPPTTDVGDGPPLEISIDDVQRLSAIATVTSLLWMSLSAALMQPTAVET